jgi:hypothetical protein
MASARDSGAETIAQLELAEIGAYADVFGAAEPGLVAAAGLRLERVGGALLTAATRADVLALNRIVGLGVRERASEAVVAEALRAMAAAGSPRYFIPVAPLAFSDDLVARLERAGARRYNNWMRLRRDVSDVPTAIPAVLEVRRIGRGDAGPFAALVGTAFGYPPVIRPLAAQTVGRPNWVHYLAFDAGEPIAAAAMYLADDVAWFGLAATASTHRNRGAQTALIMRRLADAADAGCRSVSVETAEDTVLKNAASFRNLRRLGFEVAYTRPNYLWTPAPRA